MTQLNKYLRVLPKLLLCILQILYSICKDVYGTTVRQKLKSVCGEIVLITGTGHGIGKELAIQYAKLGATVVCLDYNEKTNVKTVNEIKKTAVSPVYAYTCDVTNREKVFEVAERVKREVGDVTILINNAGIMPCHAFLDHTSDQIRRIFDVNILAHFWMLQAYLPSMIKKNHGHIVALSSIAGFNGSPYIAPYCATKFAVRGFMEALSEELQVSSKGKSLIKFTTIFPWMVNTGLCKNPNLNPELPFVELESAQDAAAQIIKAQQQDIFERSIPSFWLHLNNWGRILPREGVLYLKNFINCGVQPDS